MDCAISVDSTDIPVAEDSPIDPDMYSYKLKRAALRYEIILSLTTGNIVWLNGPFKAGACNDKSIFNNGVAHKLRTAHELAVTDKGYGGPEVLSRDDIPHHLKHLHNLYKARQETVNKRFKNFTVLSQVFRNGHYEHADCFFAVASIVQVLLQHGEPLFEIELP